MGMVVDYGTDQRGTHRCQSHAVRAPREAATASGPVRQTA
jgi:hypothetical protein